MIRWLTYGAFNRVSRICAADEITRERLIELGAIKEKIEVVGNAKYDLKPSVGSEDAKLELHNSIFNEQLPVIVLGSIRPGEEEIWFTPLLQKFKEGHAFQLIVAPRHPEKFDFFVEKLNEYQFEFDKWTELNDSGAATSKKVVLLDTLGRLEQIYSLASLVFIGGSYVDFGGHNPLEAAAYGSCIAMGPYVSNVSDVIEGMQREEAVTIVRSKSDVEDLLNKFFKQEESFFCCR